MSGRSLVSYAALLRFVEQYPEEAAEFLIGCCLNAEKKEELASVIIRANQHPRNISIDTLVTNTPYNARDALGRARASDSQRPGSSSGGRKSVHDFPTSKPKFATKSYQNNFVA